MEKIVMQKVVNMPVLHLLCLVLIIGQNGIFTQILGIFMLTLGPTSRFVLIFPKTWLVLILRLLHVWEKIAAALVQCSHFRCQQAMICQLPLIMRTVKHSRGKEMF